MNDFIEISGKQIRLSQQINGVIAPIAEDVFEIVGLEPLCIGEKIKRFYDLLELNADYAVKYVCYECDIRTSNARIRITRYLLIDLGIRLTNTEDKYLKREEFIIASYQLGNLFDIWFSKQNVLKMLERVGFNVELNSF
ncbi:hypothetical protein [uncultured Draconibacterium sp.]|uniref:hypothetical protein n=1 Tax=uncultured Draconibacterium sp. TaxID=1573823 RepID=UPI0025F47C8D|nr:hypothetical protein [uncultured Draconibacterium sp.]